TDNDGNMDSQPVVVSVKLDYVEPTIANISVSPSGTINCANTFTLNANTNDTDIKTLMFQYYDPAGGWVTIDAATANRYIMAVSTNITPNTVGLTDVSYTCVAPNITKATSLQVRAVAVDRANNSNSDASHAPVLTVTFDDTTPPVATANIDNAGNVYAETGEANIKSILFQYRIAGSTLPWIDLGTSVAPLATYGNTGDRWQSGTTLANLPAGTYDIRAVATDMFNNVNINKAPTLTTLIQVNTAGSRAYSLKKSQQISVGISDVQFDVAGGVVLTLQVQSAANLACAPVVNLLVTDGAAQTITKTVTLSGSGTTFTGTVALENFAQAGAGTARITVYGDTDSGAVYGETAGLVMSAAGTAPTATAADNMARVTAWSSALSKNASILIGPRISSGVPQAQSGLLTSIGRCYDFRLSDGTKQFPPNITATLRMDYSDADIITGVDESKLGVAWWDETNQKWSAEGISNVNLDRTANQVTFNTSHFSAFTLMTINSVPTITFESPKSGGYASQDPLISVKMDDSFSAIANPRIEIDGIDQTNVLTSFAASDGIDNNSNGLIDEKGDVLGGNFNPNANEQAFNTLSNTSGRFIIRAPLKLSPGEHTLTVTAMNVQGQSATQSIKFNVSGRLDFVSDPYNYPNPFNPKKITAKIVSNLSKEANVKVTIYDFSGQKVAEFSKYLYGQSGPINEIEWNGYEETTKKYLADGVYFASIEATSGSETIKKFLKIAITSK
ncbi:MAG: T9SS type A sorting domain-containing protein, partial [Elusimicrobiota bacterium]